MAIKTYLKAEDLRQSISQARAQGHSIGFVPTMGALHEGHLSLVAAMKTRCDFVVSSIFVNPKQFGPNEDFSTYPRMVKSDVESLNKAGVDAVFLPTAKEMYPDGFQTFVNNETMASVLCGQFRSNHFQGVLTVVLKLLNLVGPDYAAFGKKDYQQYKLIERMVLDFHLPVTIVGADIIREADGLAMSSRNLKLNSADRLAAPKLYKAMQAVEAKFKAGNLDCNKLLTEFKTKLDNSEFEIQYAEIRKQDTLELFDNGIIGKPAVFAVAAFLGGTRLIDNIELNL